MRILHVIHRVLVGLFERQVDVEHELGIGLARDQEKAHRVAAHPVDEVAHGHVRAGALGNLHFLAAAHHLHQAVQHVFGIARRDADAEGLQPGAHARDGAVVIGALHVDDLAEAALPLAEVIGDVRHEVGVAAVRFAHHPVLVVAVVGGAQPERAVLLVGLAARDERLDHLLDLALGVEAGFEVVEVEPYAESLEIGVLLFAQARHGEPAYRVQVFDAVFCQNKIASDFFDIFAVVAFFGPAGCAWLQPPRTRLHGQRELVDLGAGVVVVKLARDRMALPLQQGRDRIAERRLAAMADVQGSGRVRGHELHLNLLRRGRFGAAVVASLFESLVDGLQLESGV